ncbi:hypothetical protein A3Q56_07924, partial [Intoshia linei]
MKKCYECKINSENCDLLIGFYHNYEVITLENQEKAITNINLKVGLKLKMLPIIIIGVGVSIDLILGSKKQNLLFMDKTIGYEMYQGYMKQTFEQPKIMKLCCTNQFIPIKKFENFTSIIYENQLDMEYKIQRNIVNIQSESHTCSVNGFLNNFEPMYIIRINVPVTIHLKNIRVPSAATLTTVIESTPLTAISSPLTANSSQFTAIFSPLTANSLPGELHQL